MPDFTDILTVDSTIDLTAAQFLNRDCAFPITRLERRLIMDEVLAQMPQFTGYWNDGTLLPVLLTQSMDIDTSVVVTDCDSAVVDGDITQGELIAPDMVKFKLETKTLQIDKLVPAFCKGRNLTADNRRTLINPDGSLNLGNPYSIDFARFIFSLLEKTMSALISDRVLRGDASEDFGLDGLYTQLEHGWTNGTPTVPDALNKALVIDWGALTGLGAGENASPDDRTVAGQTISIGGDTVDVPEDYNMAQFLNDFYFPYVQAHWGVVDAYEFHVPPGTKRCIVRSAACIQPCGGDVTTIFDAELRARYAALSARDVVQLFPSGTEIAMLESPHVEAETMWLGPRSVNGDPTYGMFWRDMDEMYAQIGAFGNTYGQSGGMPMDTEPLLIDVIPEIDLPFEARVFRMDVTKISIDCVKAGLMAIIGVLAFERHLWIKFTNVTCATWVKQLKSGVTIDGVAVETHA